jgi:MinD-like ATPase involved in chromosome partitioning or flagellar assembly
MTSPPLATRAMKTIALTSGKGGVGKSNIAVNLAITLAKRGLKTCILDADTGLANINILLGVAPQHSLEHLLTGEKTLAEILIKGPAGIHIIPGASGVADCVELAPEQQALLMSGLDVLEPHYDYLIIDTGAGISPTVLHFVAAAQMPIVVITPEPTSLTDAFSLLKVLRRNNFKRPVQVLVNMAPSVNKALNIFKRFQAAVDKYIGLQVIFIGTILHHQAIADAVARQYPIAFGSPNTPACQDFKLLADNIDKTYKSGFIKSFCFSHYWQQRMAKVAQAKSSQAKPVEVALTQPSSSETKTEAQDSISALVLTPENFAEGVWQSASNQLKQLIELGSIRQEQIDQLISELRTLAISQSEKRQLPSALEKPSSIEPTNLNTGSPAGISSTELPQKEPADNIQDPSAMVLKHQYDESTFGSQEFLLKNLRESTGSGELSLLALLEKVKNQKTHQ